MKHHLISLVLFVLLMPCLTLALANDEYTLATNSQRTINLTWNESSTAYFPSINNDCAGNTCRYTYFDVYYEIPVSHLGNETPKWLVKHGGLDPYNITLESPYNSTHYYAQMVAVYHQSGGWDIGSGARYHDGTGWVWAGQNDSATPGSMTPVASTASLLYDNDFATGSYSQGNNPSVEQFYTEATNVEANLYEQDLYWATGINVDVIFTIRNEYGNPIENANVTLTRTADNQSMGVEPTDLSGKVRFTLSDDFYYEVNVSADGYNNFSGNVHILESSYTITMTTITISGSMYESIFENLTLVTTPSEDPPASLTNFTITVNDSNSSLSMYGIYTLFNGTYSQVNDTTPAGGFLNLTMDLTGFEQETIVMFYYFTTNDSTTYTKSEAFYIGGVDYNDTSLEGITDEFYGGMTPFGRALLATVVIMFLVIIISAAGLPGSWAAIVAVPGFIIGGIQGYFDPIIASMATMVLIGVFVLQNRGGL